MPKYQKTGTGIRLLDDLMGAGPVPGATPPTTPQMRAATTYEKYVQPAVLGLRNAVTSVMGDPAEDQFGGLDASADAAGPAGLGAKLAVKAGLGVLGKFVDLPRGTVLKHGGARALETVDPERLRAHGQFGRALYTSEDDFIPQHFARMGGQVNNTGRGAVTDFHVARDAPIWDAVDAVPEDLDRFAPHLDRDLLKRATRDSRDLQTQREVIEEQIGRTPDLLDRMGLAGARYPYRGSTAVAVTPEALHRGLVTSPTGQRVTDEGRRRVTDMMAGLQQARTR